METMENENKKPKIDVSYIVGLLWGRKKLFFKIWTTVFILSCLWIFPQPRYYTAEVMLAPEAGGDNAMGGLGSIAASFGLNLGGLSSSDAIYPELYPDFMTSTDFVVSLFDIPVKSLDGEINTTLYDYECKHQKQAFYKKPISWIRTKVKNWLSPTQEGSLRQVNPFMLTERQFEIVEKLRNDIGCTVDNLSSVFIIRTKAQDPLIAATLADSVRVRLQDAIIRYRTNKITLDVKHYEEVVEQARQDYEKARLEYSTFCDSHINMSNETMSSRKSALDNEVSLQYNIYATARASLQASTMKLQERTPAFTVLQNAFVPIKPAGPKRVIFVLTMLVLSTFVTAVYLLRKEIKSFVVFLQ